MKRADEYGLSQKELQEVADLEKEVERDLENERMVRVFRSEDHSHRVWDELARRAEASGFVVDRDVPLSIGISHP